MEKLTPEILANGLTFYNKMIEARESAALRDDSEDWPTLYSLCSWQFNTWAQNYFPLIHEALTKSE